MLKNRSIRAKLAVVTTIPLVAAVVFGLIAFRTLSTVKINGAKYQEIVEAKDLLADVLPPPEYLVEFYLTTYEAASEADVPARNELITHLRELEVAYRDRHEFWKQQLRSHRGQVGTAGELTVSFVDEAYATGDALLKASDGDLIPLLEAGDLDRAGVLVRQTLKPLYAAHRSVIDKVVPLAERHASEAEAEADSTVRTSTLVLGLGLLLAALVSAVLGAVVVRSIRRSVLRLRQAAQEDLPRAIAELRNADEDELDRHHLAPVDLGTNDELGEAAVAFNGVLETALGLAGEQAKLRKQTSEMFVNLGRRNQNLVSRQLRFIDSLEGTEDDPDRLAELFRLDNLATRMRRNAESLLVLAGVEAPRRWKQPVAMRDVMRSAAAEIEDFARVELSQVEPVLVQGASVSNLSHLLAELVENAARFSPPDSKVTVTGVRAGDDYVIGVHDRGMGMAADAVEAANERLRTALRLDEVPTAYLGHFVVARLAAREGARIELESPAGEGVTAWIRLPGSVLADGEHREQGRSSAAAAAPSPTLPAAPVPSAPTPSAPIPAAPAPVAPVPVSVAAAPMSRPTTPAYLPVANLSAVRPLAPPATTAGVQLPPPPPPTAARTVEEAPDRTRSGFVKRSRKDAPVSFDRFAVDEPATAPTVSASDRQRRLDQFTAGKRAATQQIGELDLPNASRNPQETNR